MTNAAYSAYAQSSFGGIESPTKLIEMLYDGILRFIFRTKKAIEAGDARRRSALSKRTIRQADAAAGACEFKQRRKRAK